MSQFINTMPGNNMQAGMMRLGSPQVAANDGRVILSPESGMNLLNNQSAQIRAMGINLGENIENRVSMNDPNFNEKK